MVLELDETWGCFLGHSVVSLPGTDGTKRTTHAFVTTILSYPDTISLFTSQFSWFSQTEPSCAPPSVLTTCADVTTVYMSITLTNLMVSALIIITHGGLIDTR